MINLDKLENNINSGEVTQDDLIRLVHFIHHSGKLSNEQLLKNWEDLRDLLNFQTIVSFRKIHGLSYNGVKFAKNLRTKLCGKVHIVDNE